MSNRWMGVLLFTVAGLAPSLVHAATDDCPDAVPESMAQRRTLAKDWFSRAETLEKARDTPAAIKAYACSMRMVPHAFTAYNLARVAEETGDLEMALGAYRAYLTLNPGAADTSQVEVRIRSLEERIAAVRASDGPKDSAVVTPTPPPKEPAEPVVTTPPSGAIDSEPVRDDQEPSNRRMGAREWVIAGGGVAALAGGIVLNMSARGKMNDCREKNNQGLRDQALQACDAAKPRAYASYGLFGAAALAAIVDTILVINKPSSSESVGVALLPGGLAVRASLRF
jgi:tetratricopeptide (TPR) repeat protein